MLIMIAFLAIAGIFDHLLHRIPNILTGAMLLSCVIYNLAVCDLTQMLLSMIRIVIVAAMFYPVFSIGALGAGDVKLFAISCGFMDADRSLSFIFVSLFVAGVMGVIKMALKKDIKRRWLTLKLYVSETVKTGKIRRYHCNKKAEEESGIPLAGAMWISALIGLGGFYR